MPIIGAMWSAAISATATNKRTTKPMPKPSMNSLPTPNESCSKGMGCKAAAPSGVRGEGEQNDQRAANAQRRGEPGERRCDHDSGNAHGLQREHAGLRTNEGVEVDHRVTSAMLAIVRPV